MKSLTAEEPDNLFPARRDAVLYLIGLGGFWTGIAVILIAADAALPSFVVIVFSGLAVSCAFLHMSTTRKFEGRLTGRSVRPWPFGYASLRNSGDCDPALDRHGSGAKVEVERHRCDRRDVFHPGYRVNRACSLADYAVNALLGDAAWWDWD